MSDKLNQLVANIPKELNPSSNPILNGLLSAWATGDEGVATAVEAARASLFVATAEGGFLDRQGSNFGVSRPSSLGLLDSDFRNLIPNLSTKAKQVVQSFYNTMQVFWGPQYLKANVTSTVAATYPLLVGDVLSLTVDSGVTQNITLTVTDVASPGFATDAEVLNLLSRFVGITAEVQNLVAGNFINVRTDTFGLRGSLQFGGAMASLGFDVTKVYKVTDLQQRCVVYQTTPGEITIEIPAVVPTLRRSLRGSHHLHADATLEGPVPPANGVWVGSFIWKRSGAPYVITSTKSTLLAPIVTGDVLSQISVASTADFPASGILGFGFGLNSEELGIPYFSIPNSNTLNIDPGYTFQKTHTTGSVVNVIQNANTPAYRPRIDGSDYAVYLTSPANARSVVQALLLGLAAAGITVRFKVLLPKYTYLFTNAFAV